MNLIDHNLCGPAIDACETATFEKFAQAFHAALVGSSFVPLGGMHDGGADGFQEQIFESSARASSFLQASKTEDFEGKIAKTIKRLRDFGRDPKVITFYFSVPVSTADQIEERFTNKEDITVRIRAKQYIETHINDNENTAQAFNSYLRPSITHLMEVGGIGHNREFPYESKTLCAFLGQELNRRRGNSSLLTTITDGLILWALEGTEPDKKIFMSKEDLLAKVEAAIPSARYFVRGVIDDRLAFLSSKTNPNGREISWHRKENVYALRFEERQKLINENIEEEGLFNSITDGIREHIRPLLTSKLVSLIPSITDIVHSCIESIFYRQGMALGLFIVDGPDENADTINMVDIISSKIDQLGLNASDRATAQEAVSFCLRKIIYAPNRHEHDYMLRLCNTYFILFALKNEPKVVEYFNSLSERLVIYVGSDLIIKAISEYYLPEQSKMVTNALHVIRKAGATLIMTEPALEEVFTHLHATTLEFEHFYSDIEIYIDEDFIPLIDRILIRAYFYARLGINTGKKAPAGWKSYVGQFCNHDDVRRKRNREGLRLYLCDRFGFEFEAKDLILKSVDRDDLSKLTFAIVAAREGRFSKGVQATKLAYNDALHMLRVGARRREDGDNSAPNPFGFKTWWLTHEKTVQRAATIVLGANRPRSIMRPEFLLNYIALAPSKREVAESYSTIFPTVLGVTLSKRANPGVLHEVLKSAREAFSTDNSRAKAKLNEFIDKLKTDSLRIYENNITSI
ncbi:hypothetical protein [Labrys miyagiensis]|uniref:hypothetical protein n=1 Tax=Labrys miyagiensis TaxID=346912 RepID=UPI0024E127D1|nr:hypothetical protein [Labrys miyagiensis]